MIFCGGHGPNRAKPLERVIADELVELFKLLIGKPEIGFADRSELILTFHLAPNAEGKV